MSSVGKEEKAGGGIGEEKGGLRSSPSPPPADPHEDETTYLDQEDTRDNDRADGGHDTKQQRDAMMFARVQV